MTNLRLPHPCFNAEARHQYGRIHLPVAPKCNIQCNFCNRKFDCVNESRPGVTSKVLSPGQALLYLECFLQTNNRISTVGIAGPGDPLANPVETLETIRLIRAAHPEMNFCLSTNGLQLGEYIHDLADLGVSHVTVTLNAVDPAIGARIYAWVREGKVIYRGYDGAALLLGRQLLAIAELKRRNITAKVNTIIIPGVNDAHIAAVAQKAAELGADVMNCMPLLPAKHSNFATLPAPEAAAVDQIRSQAEVFLPQMQHCARCRADAAGLIGEALTPTALKLLGEAAQMPLVPQQSRPYIAVATLEGLLINQHLGEAEELSIFKMACGKAELVEVRSTPLPGGGDARWKQLAAIIADCHTLLVNGIGQNPTAVLKAAGIKIYETEGIIENAIQALDKGESLRTKACVTKCGFSCKGDGLGCG